MQVNEKDFFHQITIRICGNLEIDKALMSCFQYLKNFLPLDELRLALLHKGYRAHHILATADASGGRKIDKIIPLPQTLTTDLIKRGKIHMITIFNQLDFQPEARKLLCMKGQENSSFIGLLLVPNGVVEGVEAGGLFTRVTGENRYTNDHARLLASLHDPFAIAMTNALRHEEVSKLKNMLADDNQYLARELHQIAGDEIVGREQGLKHVMEMIQQIAPRNNPVLLMGETGVGKEIIANTIHYTSPRRNGPFIKVNCGSIPEGLIDDELFGHEKGAFTGALTQKRGRFERADKGSIFLDEIGELPMEGQTRLLRIIQQKELERVGGTKTIRVDTRIIAATNRNLEQMVDNKKFREDLWYRLNVFPIIIPPLRQRKNDIPELVKHFLKQKAKDLNLHKIPPIEPGTLEQLMTFPWKGNVRELENVVERALIRHSGGSLNFDSFFFSPSWNHTFPFDTNNTIKKLDEIIALHIQSAMKAANGRINGPGGAAELLGLNPSTLRFKINKLGLPNKGRA